MLCVFLFHTDQPQRFNVVKVSKVITFSGLFSVISRLSFRKGEVPSLGYFCFSSKKEVLILTKICFTNLLLHNSIG